MKLTGATYVWNNLKFFEYGAQSITGNGKDGHLLKPLNIEHIPGNGKDGHLMKSAWKKSWNHHKFCLKKLDKFWKQSPVLKSLHVNLFCDCNSLTNLIMERNRKQSPETDVMLICWMLLEENLWNHIKWIRFWRIFEMLNHYACSRLTPRPSSAAPGAWPPCTATSAWS